MLHILAIGSVILGIFEYLLASDKADQRSAFNYLSCHYYVN